MCAFSELSCLCVVSRNRKTQDSQTTTSASNCFEGGEIRKHSVNVLFWAFFFLQFQHYSLNISMNSVFEFLSLSDARCGNPNPTKQGF